MEQSIGDKRQELAVYYTQVFCHPSTLATSKLEIGQKRKTAIGGGHSDLDQDRGSCQCAAVYNIYPQDSDYQQSRDSSRQQYQ